MNFSGRKWAVWKVNGDLDRWQMKSENDRKGLLEKDDVRAARLAYVRNTSRERNEARPISERTFCPHTQRIMPGAKLRLKVYVLPALMVI
jgi:hypothetical protein